MHFVFAAFVVVIAALSSCDRTVPTPAEGEGEG